MATRLNIGSGSVPSAPFPALAGDNSAAFETLARAGASYAKACVDCQQELTRFVGARFEQDQKLGQSLSGCKNLSDMLQVQQQWALTAAQDYLNEIGRLGQIALGLVQVGVGPFRQAERRSSSESTER